MRRTDNQTNQHTTPQPTVNQGKTLADARGDVFRGLEVVELACGAASLMMGETLEGLASGKGVGYARWMAGRDGCALVVGKTRSLTIQRHGVAIKPNRRGHVLVQAAAGRVRGHLPLQLPRHDPSLDVPHRRRLRSVHTPVYLKHS